MFNWTKEEFTDAEIANEADAEIERLKEENSRLKRQSEDWQEAARCESERRRKAENAMKSAFIDKVLGRKE